MQNETPPAGIELPSTPCLDRAYASRNQKGGTVIATGVGDLEAHARTLADPDLVRPCGCVTCGAVVHVHDRKGRQLRGRVEGPPAIEILIFRCAREGCRAVWRVLPAFLARCLWRTWDTVAGSLTGEAPRRHVVPEQTLGRWRMRLREAARVVVMLLGQSGDVVLRDRAMSLGLWASRKQVVEAFGGLGQLAEVAALCHRLEPGVRIV